MSVLSYSKTLVPGANENVGDVQQMFNEVKAILNGQISSVNVQDASLVGADLVADTITAREIADAYSTNFAEPVGGGKLWIAMQTASLPPHGVAGVPTITGGVAHGLGRSPLGAIVMPRTQNSSGWNVEWVVTGWDATYVQVAVQDIAGANFPLGYVATCTVLTMGF